MSIRSFLVAAFVLLSATVAFSQTKLLRFPDIHGDRIVFNYGGDLWTVSSSGGTAVRLTAHPGMETFPKFSPDGKWIAFTGQYDGDEQVYVMPATGGEPKQLTFYPSTGPLTPRWGYDNQVYGWTKDNKVVFRGMRESWTLPVTRLYTVSANGGPVEPMPMPEAGSGDLSPDGTKIAYSPQFRDFRPEKRYAGGQANTLYIYDLATNDARKISDNPFANRDPMWIGNSIYFISDKDGKFNLYAYSTSGGKAEQVTKFRDWDIRWPGSDGDKRIVWERDGELEVFDVSSKKAAKLNINVPNDGINRRKRQISAAQYVSSYGISPKGERAVVSARGDIFTVPIEKGGVRNLTNSSGSHDKLPTWSPDGRNIAFISDASGEEEVWLVPQDGSAPATQLTTGSKAQKYGAVWSADSKKLLYSDKDARLYVLDVASKQARRIAEARNGLIFSYEWSPQGNYVAFVMNLPNGMSGVHVWNAADNSVTLVSPRMFNSAAPAWDPNGDYLYFISAREFAPQISQSEYNFATTKMGQIYALALRKDVKHPFPMESDEVTIAAEATPSPSPSPASSPTPGTPAASPTPSQKAERIDFDGIVNRASKVPLPADNYGGLAANKGHIIYSVGGPFFNGRSSGVQPSLRIFSLKDRKETTLLQPGGGYDISADGMKLLVSGQGGLALLDANPAGERSRKAVSLSGLVMEVDPAREWEQIFNEVWRRYRDWFYVENMHGFDWEKIREDYKKWLPYVAHRADLNYLISEMSSELTVQHAYIAGGDIDLPSRVRVALAGAVFTADKAAGRYKIARIYNGQNEEDIYRSPLTEVGVNVNVGDYVLAVNGQEIRTDRDVYAYFRGKATSSVTLTVNDKPTLEGSRKVTFRPLTSESDLIYLDWTEANRKRVSELSNGRIGYLHIPDMGPAGIREFIKWYYPQIDKEGLVVDVRANGGGNVSRMLIERLRRKVLGVNYRRGDPDGTTYPDGTFIGPMAAILNENSASDGDIFPHMFREAGLGPLIGKRSWGGVVGITNRGNLIDGGVVNVPEFALANPKGEYIIEGYGVDPDIEVENDPRSVIAGRDPQLERAVEEVMKKLARPVKLPPKPADPNRNKNE
ncbi:MAG: PD40 domain-containing protein [Acidobacteria bacterium]|nr:PD40 domain-containing protein [Acidobacteriota bacterium]